MIAWPTMEGSGSSDMISTVEPVFCTVIVAWSLMVTPPAVAVIVFVSATVELKVNVTTPLVPLDAVAGCNGIAAAATPRR